MGSPFDFTTYQTGRFEHFQMFGNSWLRNTEGFAQLICRQRALPSQHGYHFTSGLVSKSMKGAIER